MAKRHKPVIVKSREVARSRLFRVEALDLEFANGNTRTFERLRGTGQGAGAVMIVALPDPEHVLLIREYAAGYDDYVLTLPKGAIDPGESLLAAANRELKEECGFGARSIEPLTELSVAPNYMSHRISVVLATDLYEERLAGDEPEPIVTEKHRWDELPALLAREDFHEGRAIAALFIARERLRDDQPPPSWW